MDPIKTPDVIAPSEGKLVRDGIPEIIRRHGVMLVSRFLSEEEYRVALLEKIVEEVQELISAAWSADMVGEIVDVLEVLMAWLQTGSIQRTVLPGEKI